MKEITKQEIKLLEKHDIIKNTHKGYIGVDDGYQVGFYRTVNKRYIQDKYADIAKTLT